MFKITLLGHRIYQQAQRCLSIWLQRSVLCAQQRSPLQEGMGLRGVGFTQQVTSELDLE